VVEHDDPGRARGLLHEPLHFRVVHPLDLVVVAEVTYRGGRRSQLEAARRQRRGLRELPAILDRHQRGRVDVGDVAFVWLVDVASTHLARDLRDMHFRGI
jgi:hypothetical protein